MLKNILNIDGAQKLTANEQKEINGGLTHNCTRGRVWCGTGGALCREDSPCTNGCCIPA